MLVTDEQQIMKQMGFTPTPQKLRRSKYPKTHPRYWLSVYARNGRNGQPRYLGIPAAMHEPLLKLKREICNRSYAKKRAKQKLAAKRRAKREAAQSAADAARQALLGTEAQRAEKRLADLVQAQACQQPEVSVEDVVAELRVIRQECDRDKDSGWWFIAAVFLGVLGFVGLLMLMTQLDSRTLPHIEDLDARLARLEAATAHGPEAQQTPEADP